jgi:hypothetical protein
MTEKYQYESSASLRVSLADVKAAIGFRVDTTGVKMLGEGDFPNGVFFGPAGKPLRQMSICILVTWGGVVIVGKHAATNGEQGADLAYKDAIQQLWSLIGMASKGRFGRALWHRSGWMDRKTVEGNGRSDIWIAGYMARRLDR